MVGHFGRNFGNSHCNYKGRIQILGPGCGPQKIEKIFFLWDFFLSFHVDAELRGESRNPNFVENGHVLGELEPF